MLQHKEIIISVLKLVFSFLTFTEFIYLLSNCFYCWEISVKLCSASDKNLHNIPATVWQTQSTQCLRWTITRVILCIQTPFIQILIFLPNQLFCISDMWRLYRFDNYMRKLFSSTLACYYKHCKFFIFLFNYLVV